MSEIIQQRSSIKFCVRNEISAAKTLEMLQKAFGVQALSKTRVYEWYKMFKEGRESVEDEARSGRPSTSTDELHVNEIKKLVLQNPQLTVRDLCELVRISEGSVKTILSDHLGLRKVKSRLVPKMLNFMEKRRRVIRDFFAKNSTHIVPQAPYSPDMAPCDFWLFSKLKRPLRGYRFESIEEIQTATKKELKAIPKEDYAACFENWKKRWHMCIASGGDYFEGDDMNLEE